MDFLCYGDALWEPAPTHHYTRINIGDVGFIRRGQFHLLFSAGSPVGERRLGDDVPITFEELPVETPVSGQPRLPGCLHTDTVREIGAGLDATASATLSLEPGASFSFELTGNRGAALVTKYPTYKEDSLLESAFESYTKRHYESWVRFARHKQYGNDVQPVLISGFDMTSDFAMAAYSHGGTSPESDLTTIAVPMLGASASLWGTWRTRCLPHTNCGPQWSPHPRARTIDFLSESADAGRIPDGFNQCVFIRYYTMRPRKRMALFSKVIRAGAGPHDLGSGDNKGDTYPELAVQSDVESTMSGDENLGGRYELTADSTGSEPDIVVRNTPYDEEYDDWDVIADYIFQNSNAVYALMHHRDLAGIRMAGDRDSMSVLLAKHRPLIAIDKNGVGRILHEETQQHKLLTRQVNREGPGRFTHESHTSIDAFSTSDDPSLKHSEDSPAFIAGMLPKGSEKTTTKASDDDDNYSSDNSSILTEIGSQDFPGYFVEYENRLFPSRRFFPSRGDPYSSYPFPVDGREQNRMNTQHYLLKELLGSNYAGPVRALLAPCSPQRQIKVLDLCTGTGKWAVEMAEEFPHVKFNALDIVPITTMTPPQNVSFEVHDVTTRTRFPDKSFDLVHARHCSLLPRVDYAAMLSEALRVLRPGGLILLGEWIHPPVDASTGRSPPGVTAFCQALDKSLQSAYTIDNISPFLTDFISQLGSFNDIQSSDYYMPTGDMAWSFPRAKDLSVKFKHTLGIWAESAAMVLARAGYDKDTVKGLTDGFMNDISNVEGLQVAYRVVTARRVA